MQSRLNSNAGALARRFQARAEAVRPALERAAVKVARVVQIECRRVMTQKIYSAPIPLTARADARLRADSPIRGHVNKGRHGQWRRTGALRRAEQAKPKAGGAVALTNDRPYAKARHQLGLPGGRRIVSPGVQPAPWRTEGIARTRRVVLELRRREVVKALRAAG